MRPNELRTCAWARVSDSQQDDSSGISLTCHCLPVHFGHLIAWILDNGTPIAPSAASKRHVLLPAHLTL